MRSEPDSTRLVTLGTLWKWGAALLFTVEASGDAQCRRTDHFSVEAKLFGLGGLIESSIEKELQSARAKEYAFLKRWILLRS